jgi:DnaK suppressor protein
MPMMQTMTRLSASTVISFNLPVAAYSASLPRRGLTDMATISPDKMLEIEDRLREMRAAILSLEAARRDSSGVVELDQSRTGRLSRMDALQLQAMAQAEQVRSQVELRQIEAALERLKSGDFGVAPIAANRLQRLAST